MAIYSLNHSSIGRSTHGAGTAGAHVAYITREKAAGAILAERMPTDGKQARAWIDEAEAGERKNGRICDKVMAALPLELDAGQRAELVRRFGDAVTRGRGSWLAAIHDKGKDGRNPHAHVVIRDKDVETGKRVALLSEKGSTERLRALWEELANDALEEAGHEARIDRRTLEAQGIDRKPQIHVGPRAKAMVARGAEPVSRIRRDARGRVIQYPWIDIDVAKPGRFTRSEYNERIVQDNEMRAEHRRQNAAWRARVEAEREARERKDREDRAREDEAWEATMEQLYGIEPAKTRRPVRDARETAEAAPIDARHALEGEKTAPEGMEGIPGEKHQNEAESAPEGKKTALAGVSPREEFAAACLGHGLVIEGEPVMDGEWHRVQVAGDGVGEARGMYRGCLDGDPSGTIVNSREGETVAWVYTGRVEVVEPTVSGKEDGGVEIAMEAGPEAAKESSDREAPAVEKAGEPPPPWRGSAPAASGPRLGEWSRAFLLLMGIDPAMVEADPMFRMLCALIDSLGVPVRESGHASGYYSRREDAIYLPPREGSRSKTEYLSEGLRLMAEATGHESRLDWRPAPHGTEARTREQVRAEAAGFLVAREIGVEYRDAQAGLDREDLDGRFEAMGEAERQIQPFRDDPGELVRMAEGAAAVKRWLLEPEARESLARETKERAAAEERAGGGLEAAAGKEGAAQESPRHYLAVPYGEREKAWLAGARWDREVRSWHAPAGSDRGKLSAWDTVSGAAADRGLSPQEEFGIACREQGLIIEGDPVMDGKWRRAPVTADRGRDRSGMYLGRLDGGPSGKIRNFKNAGQKFEVAWAARSGC